MTSILALGSSGDTASVVTPLPLGDIQFLDNFIPTLDPGDYAISVTQTLAVGTPAPASVPADFPPPAYSTTKTLTVGGAGLSLASTDVYSVYPPKNSAGNYTEVLPHVVLNPRTLPWEVQLTSSAATPATPWLALILLADSEVAQMQTVSLATAQQPATGLLVPQVPASEAANTNSPVTVVDVTTATFTALLPQLAEVPYLAHCRQVNVAAKEDDLTSGWFSVVVANRFPSAPTGPRRFTAHLVSLYGLDGYLASPPTALPAGTTTIRLLSLTHWSFTCDPAQSLDFRALMTNLAVPPANTAVGDSSYLLLKLPTTPPAASGGVNFNGPMHQAVGQAFAAGYVLTPYATRQGDHVTAWYRGPLCPTPTPRLPLDPLGLADEAMIYDPSTGMFDHSYAVAWQTGRMLALSDRNFATKLTAWRNRGQQLLNQLYLNLQQNPALAGTMAQQAGGNPNVQELRSLLEPDLLGTGTFLPFVATAFAQSVGIPLSNPPAAVPLPSAAAAPASGVASAVSAALTALAGEPWVQSALQALTADHLAGIAEWLGRMGLLNGVPFANLVPDVRMLPEESIRFFYVDQTYLDAMVDGALSVGIRSSRDTQFNEIMHAVLRDAVDSEMATVRAELLGQAPAAGGVAGSMAGFLLRSAVVGGFPGLEVQAQSASGTTLPALRIDRLAPDVLIALFPAAPSQVSLSEPQEGLRFGVEDNSLIDLRSTGAAAQPAAGTQLGQSVTAQYRAHQVFDVAGTLGQIAQQCPALATIGPAGFAVQMVKSPEQMNFYGASS